MSYEVFFWQAIDNDLWFHIIWTQYGRLIFYKGSPMLWETKVLHYNSYDVIRTINFLQGLPDDVENLPGFHLEYENFPPRVFKRWETLTGISSGIAFEFKWCH
jgi:hypothetical protein